MALHGAADAATGARLQASPRSRPYGEPLIMGSENGRTGVVEHSPPSHRTPSRTAPWWRRARRGRHPRRCARPPACAAARAPRSAPAHAREPPFRDFFNEVPCAPIQNRHTLETRFTADTYIAACGTLRVLITTPGGGGSPGYRGRRYTAGWPPSAQPSSDSEAFRFTCTPHTTAQGSFRGR